MGVVTKIVVLALIVFSIGCQPERKSATVESEIEFRLRLIQDRIFKGKTPEITQDFLLADLTLDPQFARRFTDYSGDQIGRYLSTISMVEPVNNPINIHELVRQIGANQKADGRFGADSLVFKAEAMEGAHMALLWGNGRLLAGLMDYYAKYPDQKHALETAQKLGDFLIGVTDACTRPQIIERFKTMGALGFICFTQIIEGMVKLYEQTGNDVYIEIAEKIYPLLPEFGNQHSHGFLNTLRGVVMLYEATKNPLHLAYAEAVFDKILISENYMITGGVPEYFGFHASAEEIRDEGCSEADFFMLCLQLWRATGKMSYLNHAEYLFMNHMLFNQFASGDFGSHVIETRHDLGFCVAAIQAKSWWCCNYHGLQALIEAKQALFSTDNRVTKINLYYPETFSDNNFAFTLKKIKGTVPQFVIKVDRVIDKNARLALRNPFWSEKTEVRLNGKILKAREENGYLFIDRPLKPKDVVQIDFQPALKLINRQQREVDVSELTDEPQTAAMIYGPWLMTVDDITEPLFMAEPSIGNVIFLPEEKVLSHPSADKIPNDSFNPEAYLSFNYRHESLYEINQVILRPLSENTFQNPANIRFWFNFTKK